MSSSASISRSIFPLTDDLDRACFGRDRNSRDQVGMIDDTTRAIFGRSYAAEPDVLLLVAEGLTNAEIAERLYIGAGTVKTHIARLLAKLDARDRVQLVIHAYRSGLTG